MAKQGTVGWLFGWLFKWADEHGCELSSPPRKDIEGGIIRVEAPGAHYFELGRHMCIDAHGEGWWRNRLVARLNEWWEAVEAVDGEA